MRWLTRTDRLIGGVLALAAAAGIAFALLGWTRLVLAWLMVFALVACLLLLVSRRESKRREGDAQRALGRIESSGRTLASDVTRLSERSRQIAQSTKKLASKVSSLEKSPGGRTGSAAASDTALRSLARELYDVSLTVQEQQDALDALARHLGVPGNTEEGSTR